jgi:hypothetical protein
MHQGVRAMAAKEVEDACGAREGGLELRHFRDVGLDERRRRVHVRAEAGAQRVDDRDGVALAHEAVDHVRADKACAARDDVLAGPRGRRCVRHFENGLKLQQ